MSDSDRAGARSRKASRVSLHIFARNRLLREALERAFAARTDIETVGSAEKPQAGLDAVAALRPQVVLIDGGSLEFDWVKLVTGIRRAAVESRVVLFGMPEDAETFFSAIRAGVVGYVLSESSGADLVTAVRCAARNEAFCPARLCLALFNYVVRSSSSPAPLLRAKHGLTRREQQLLPLISEGLTNKEIATRLALSEQTVKNHIGSILRKMGARDRLSAAHAATTSAYGI